jgi:hypothetical protein
MSKRLWLGGCMVVAMATALQGCSTRIQSDPTSFDVPPDSGPGLRGPQRVALKNAYETETLVVVMRSGQSKAEADLRQFTGTALRMLERRLQRDGIVADPLAPKTISLRVRDMSVIPSAFIVRVVLTVEAEFGNARRTFRARDGSPDAQRALDSAIALALAELVNDEQFVAYVNRR